MAHLFLLESIPEELFYMLTLHLNLESLDILTIVKEVNYQKLFSFNFPQAYKCMIKVIFSSTYYKFNGDWEELYKMCCQVDEDIDILLDIDRCIENYDNNILELIYLRFIYKSSSAIILTALMTDTGVDSLISAATVYKVINSEELTIKDYVDIGVSIGNMINESTCKDRARFLLLFMLMRYDFNIDIKYLLEDPSDFFTLSSSEDPNSLSVREHYKIISIIKKMNNKEDD
jgi:hypothetical protein